MIDLKGAKVGDKFNGNKGGVLELALKGKCGDFVLIDEESGQIIVTDSNGDGTNCSWEDVVSKHDPRPWLKDLPDADLFSDAIKWVGFCRDTDEWRGFEFEPVTYHSGWQTSNSKHKLYMISGFKMPTLTGDQWKDSRISILALKTWQLANQ